MKHAKGRSSHAGIKTTITKVYKILFVHNYHTKMSKAEKVAS
jgi:hypothetical protein